MEVSQKPPSVFTMAIWHFLNYRRLHGSLIFDYLGGFRVLSTAELSKASSSKGQFSEFS